MKLDKLILVNWGALRTQEYPMGNMTLLTGPTGSGKSTMLDALQTVMTAVYQGIFSYNPGQDETNQGSRNGKSKRTLWSYIAGAEDNLFARPDGAHGYIGAVFKPSEGEEGDSFTALVAAAARVDGSGNRRIAIQERFALLILDNVELKLEDLMNIEEDSVSVIPVEKIADKLTLAYPKCVNNYREVKREYLSQLYGRFRGKKSSVSFPEAEQAARAWSQSIAHKPIGSVDELVKTQILEQDMQELSQRITQISDMMRHVAGLRNDGERLKANISRLELISASADSSSEAYQSALQFQLANSKRALQDDDARKAAAERNIEELTEKIASEQRLSAGLSKDLEARRTSQVQISTSLAGIPAAAQKQALEEKLAQADETTRASIKSLQASIAAADNLQRVAKQVLGTAFPTNLRPLEDAASRVGTALSLCTGLSYASHSDVLDSLASSEDLDMREVLGLSRAFEGADAKFAGLHLTLTGFENSFVSALHAQTSRIQTSIADAEKRERDAASRKSGLAKGGSDYPQDIRFALENLRSELKGAGVQVLCDLIEPTGLDWQPAVEAYMGANRFNFIVDPAWESRVISFLSGRKLKGSVIQGSQCLKYARPELVSSGSIIHELSCEHPVAAAYLNEQYGTVVKVPDADTLTQTPRGVTMKGECSGSRAMFSREVKLVFGKEAKRLARERADLEHAQAEAELTALRSQQRDLTALLALVGSASRPDFSATEALEQATRDVAAHKANLARLDLKEVKELEAQYEALTLEIRAISEKLQESAERKGEFNGNTKEQNAELARLANSRVAKQNKARDDASRLQNLCMVNGALTFTAMERVVDELLASNSMSMSEIQTRAGQKLIEAQRSLGDLREALADYNVNSRNDERFTTHFGTDVRNDDFAPIYAQIVVLGDKVREQLVAQREIGLVKNLDQLRIAESSFKDVFTKQFCYEIRNRVEGGTKTLKLLNIELDKLKFGTDKFHIDWGQWVPEYLEYFNFFTAAYDMSESQEVGDLFGESQLSAENCRVRDKLVKHLLSDDQESARKELQRIADYRNYRRYEIWKVSDTGSRVALSEWGTGSGGQLETPAYIVRAAVVTNRLKHFDRGSKLKLMVNDESFAKMDERRAHDVLKFMRDNLGMQLLCAMPTKHAGAIKSEFTKEWSFTRTEAGDNGEVDFVSESDERDINTDKLRSLWDARRQQVRDQAKMKFDKDEPEAP